MFISNKDLQNNISISCLQSPYIEINIFCVPKQENILEADEMQQYQNGCNVLFPINTATRLSTSAARRQKHLMIPGRHDCEICTSVFIMDETKLSQNILLYCINLVGATTDKTACIHCSYSKNNNKTEYTTGQWYLNIK